MNKSILITVRMGSTRLPNKALMEINGKSTTEHLISRVKRSQKADNIILCTTHLPEDDILGEIAKNNNISCFRGPVEDKLERWNGACRMYDIEFFVTADGDDLFCEPMLIDLAFDQYEKYKFDFVESSQVICGAFTYGISSKALKEVCEIKDSEDTEMMWTYFKDTGLFKIQELESVDPIFYRDDIRMTLDYKDDFEFFKRIIEHYESKDDKYYNLYDIIKYLDANPEIIKINQYLQKEWKANQIQKTKLVLKEFK
ncbi:MAG: hypothetical protein ABIA04_04545 [Pseudomonadota bacterium]